MSISILTLVGLICLTFSRVSKKRIELQFGSEPLVQEEKYFFFQVLDHFDYSNKIFWRQRYYVNTEYWDPSTGAVLYYICGEYNCPGVPSSRQWSSMIAKETKSIVLVLEHRYYGQSVPNSLNTSDFKFLNKQQALADLACFQNYVVQNNLYNISKNPWFVVGGSYPGALSGWYRYKYPHLTVGSIASSAVVNMQVDFWKFDQQIYLSSVKSGTSCPDRISSLLAYVQSRLATNNDQTKRDFYAQKLTDGEFLFFFTDMIVETIQYGGRTALCNRLGTQASANYLYFKANPAANYKDYGSYYLSDVAFAQKDKGGARSWAWQTCTEVGWFQTPSRQHRMRSTTLNVTWWLKWCKDIFGSDLVPRTEQGNTQLGGINLNVPNLILTNGAQDPWRWAGLQQDKGFVKSYVIDCPDCAHCQDLRTPADSDAQILKTVRAQQLKAVKAWISSYWMKERKVD